MLFLASCASSFSVSPWALTLTDLADRAAPGIAKIRTPSRVESQANNEVARPGCEDEARGCWVRDFYLSLVVYFDATTMQSERRKGSVCPCKDKYEALDGFMTEGLRWMRT